MKAVGLYRYLPIDHPESLVDVEVETPHAAGHDLLVRVQAVSVNPVDTKVRAPKDEVENEPKILGYDVAGIVESVGPDVTLFQPGDEVYYAGSITRQGGNSEFHLVDERIVGKKPGNLSFAEAAALPLTTLTAWEALFDRLEIPIESPENKDKSILIISAAGGVGSIATQLAKKAGLNVIGTASRTETSDWAKRHGADHIINHYEPLAPQLKEIGFETVDYIFCLNATDKHWDGMVEVIAPQGKICGIAETKDPLPLSDLQQKSATFVWEFMFTRAMFQTSDMIEQHHILTNVSQLVETGSVVSTVTETLSPINASNLRIAHQKVEAGDMIGKVVVADM